MQDTDQSIKRWRIAARVAGGLWLVDILLFSINIDVLSVAPLLLLIPVTFIIGCVLARKLNRGDIWHLLLLVSILLSIISMRYILAKHNWAIVIVPVVMFGFPVLALSFLAPKLAEGGPEGTKTAKKGLSRNLNWGCLVAVLLAMVFFLAILFPGMEGMRERGRRGHVERAAKFAAEVDLKAWMAAAAKANTSQGDQKEVDTNADDIIDDNDMSNNELAKAGAITSFIVSPKGSWNRSPWGVKPLWVDGGMVNKVADCRMNYGQITLCYSGPNQGADITAIHLIAADKEGNVLYSRSIRADK